MTIGKGVECIGWNAFEDCTSLKRVYWNAKNVKDLKSCAEIFGDAGTTNAGIKLVFGDSVERIPRNAVRGTKAITSIIIPDTVKSIGYLAFYDTAFYNDRDNWEQSALYIGKHLIRARKSLKGDYEIKKDTITIADKAFSKRKSIKSVVIPDSVKNIGREAFLDCFDIKTLYVGKGVERIDSDAFESCLEIEKVNITDLGAWCNIRFENWLSTPVNYSKKLYINDELAENVVIPDSVTKIGEFAFTECKSIKKIQIPDTVKIIGDYAFSDCTNLKSLVIPDSVTRLGESAFSYCLKLVKATIGKGVTSISAHCFRGCSSLTSIKISDSVKTIGYYAFSDCSTLTSVVIPDGVTKLDESAFSDCYNLQKVKFGESVKYLGDYCFYGCSSLTDVKLPKNIISIGMFCFNNCKKITEIKVPVGAKSIGYGAFCGCKNLSSISLPDSIKSIGYVAFYNTEFYSNKENWEKKVLYIGNHLIRAKTTIKGDYKVTDGTITIADMAFSDCDDLTSVKIPDSVKNIGADIYKDCDKLS